MISNFHAIAITPGTSFHGSLDPTFQFLPKTAVLWEGFDLSSINSSKILFVISPFGNCDVGFNTTLLPKEFYFNSQRPAL